MIRPARALISEMLLLLGDPLDDPGEIPRGGRRAASDSPLDGRPRSAAVAMSSQASAPATPVRLQKQAAHRLAGWNLHISENYLGD